MSASFNPLIIKSKVAELAFTARVVVQQLGSRDCSPEGLVAQKMLEDAIMKTVTADVALAQVQQFLKQVPKAERINFPAK